MPADLVTIALTAVTTSVATGVTLVLGLRRLRLDREKQNQEQKKIELEMQKVRAETARLQLEMDESRKQANATAAAVIDIEKQRLAAISSTRDQIFPQLLEIVYRLRNSLRAATKTHSTSLSKEYTGIFQYPEYVSGLHPELGTLTEDLYKFRAYIDEPTFQLLHRFKRLMQDAPSLLDACSRPNLLEASDEEMASLAGESGIDVEAKIRSAADHLRHLEEDDARDEEDDTDHSDHQESNERGSNNAALTVELKSRLSRKIHLARMSRIQPRLEQLESESEGLYQEITRGVQTYFSTILSRVVSSRDPDIHHREGARD